MCSSCQKEHFWTITCWHNLCSTYYLKGHRTLSSCVHTPWPSMYPHTPTRAGKRCSARLSGKQGWSSQFLHQAAHTLGTGVVKVPSTTFKGVLQMLGVGEVYVGRYGMKQYLVPDPDTALSQFQDIPTLHTSADFGHMIKEEGVMWLFGLPANQNGTFIDHPNNLKWRVLPLMPGAQGALGGYVYGTLEGKPLASGPFGSPECKMFQVYSLIHHTRLALTSMEIQYPSRPQDMANKKKALLQYTQQLLDHADRACGGRVEVRVKAPNDTPHSFKDLWPYGQMLLQHVQEMIHKGVIQIKKLPVDEAKAHIMAAWDWAEKSNTFRAHQEGDPSFETKKLIYFNLVSSLGFASGKWQRPVLANIREPISVPQAGVQWLPRLHIPMPPEVPQLNPPMPPPADIFQDTDSLWAFILVFWACILAFWGFILAFWSSGSSFWPCGPSFWPSGLSFWPCGLSFWSSRSSFWPSGPSFWPFGPLFWPSGPCFA